MVHILLYAFFLSALFAFVLSFNSTNSFRIDPSQNSISELLRNASSDAWRLAAPAQNSTDSRPDMNGMQYLCTPDFGDDLDVRSCADAVRQLDIRSMTPSVWGERGTGEFSNVYLPRRYMSTDGKCFVEPLLQARHLSGIVSQHTLAAAGIVLAQRCAGGRPSTGGIARRLGGDNHIAVVLSKYEPAVQCYGQVSRTPLFKRTCQDLLDRMDVSEDEKRFGRATDPKGVDVVLPLTLKAGYLEQCFMTVTTTGESDVLSMMDVWEAGVAINAMCIRLGKKGVWSAMGLHDRLSVSVSDDTGTGSSLDTSS